ncbi:hypothetical protein OP10G_0457 [Fimbriimonas ginsengisoli Gsoil 348]|uniref:Uncharacterized protein n=1 Tax=Fimbriimonas ginsengisoli Gsoil 348 TaxID=661478 RepID=A0A068NM14_FIMGI|nr:hypothetical protein OP10G_0457 [Fimbriimonas ginsengisoli Gsoil 348]
MGDIESVAVTFDQAAPCHPRIMSPKISGLTLLLPVLLS